MKGDKGRQGAQEPGNVHQNVGNPLNEFGDKQRQAAHGLGQGHPHEGRQRETSGDKQPRDPAGASG